jgi:hypothetical protein
MTASLEMIKEIGQFGPESASGRRGTRDNPQATFRQKIEFTDHLGRPSSPRETPAADSSGRP